MSESFIYSAGLGNVGSYQASGIPWVSGGISATTIKSVSFPYVTRWIYVVNNGTGDLKVGFSQNGVQGSRYFTVQAATAGKDTTTIRLEVKATELWFSGSTSVDIVAGLTNIPVGRINNSANSPSGSNWSGSANV